MTSGLPADLDALVTAASGGDRSGLNSLLRAIEPMIIRYCRGHLGRNDPAVDDVARRICLDALRALPTRRGPGRPFLAVLHGIAARAVRDAAAADGEVGWRRGLDTLPDEQREILLLRVVAGLSAEQTATAVGSTIPAVRVLQHRALARLRAVDS